MTVISLFVVSNAGSLVLGKQFVPISRRRLESLASDFFQHWHTQKSHDHTLITTDTHRFVYLAVDDVYVVLASTRLSNIATDVAALGIAKQLVRETCEKATETGRVTSETVHQLAFDIIFGFDEIIAPIIGVPDTLSATALDSQLLMESHSEMVHNMIVDRKAREMQEVLKRQSKDATMTGTPYPLDSETLYDLTEVQYTLTQPDRASPLEPEPSLARPVQKPSRRMPPAPSIVVEEHLSASMLRDGAISNMELRGSLSVLPDSSNVDSSVVLRAGSFDMSFTTHPTIDKREFELQRILTHKQGSASFVANKSYELLRWRSTSKTASILPLSVSCWTEDDANSTRVTVDVNATATVRRFRLEIPLPRGLGHAAQVSEGVQVYGTSAVWSEDVFANGESKSCSIEVATNTENLFPMQVMFELDESIAGVQPVGFSGSGTNETAIEYWLHIENFHIL